MIRMVKRKIIKIDKEKCNGCGNCIPNCPEGAIQIIDGKAQIISDIFCDGLGACMGYCPEGAISSEEREAEPYDERKVMQENIIPAGKNTILAHLNHLHEHGETQHLDKALELLKEKGIEIEFDKKNGHSSCHSQGCPGAKTIDFSDEETQINASSNKISTQLRQWPVQLHLVSPNASYFKGSDVLLVADCVAYSLGNFHNEFLKGKSLAIACPKQDSNIETYTEKIVTMIDTAKINTLTVITMEVPCCTGLLILVQKALERSSRKIPLKHIVISIRGEVVKDNWI